MNGKYNKSFWHFTLKFFLTHVHCVFPFTFDYSTTTNSPKILPEKTPLKIEYSTKTNSPKIKPEKTPLKHESMPKKEVKPLAT